MKSCQAFTSAQLCEIFPGLSLRQIQWWDENGIVVAGREQGPGGRGWIRIYDARQTEMIGIVVQLREKGFSQKRLRRSLRDLERMKLFAPWLLVLMTGAILPAADQLEATEQLARSRSFGAVIDVGRIRQRIKEWRWKQ